MSQSATTSHRRAVPAPVAAVALLVGAIVLMVVGASCGVEDSKHPPPATPPPSSGGSGGTGGTPTAVPCPEGSTRDCHVTLGVHNGVISCFDGVQTCVGGEWGACLDGTTSTRPAPSGSGSGGTARPSDGTAKPLSLSMPVACVDNPCDPYCQVFNEDPTGGILPNYTVTGTYQSGSQSSIPAGFIGTGISEPCSADDQCQFDNYCQDPTKANCLHNMCATGEGLVAGCNNCTAALCAADPTCCSPPSGTCAHDKCTAGAALDNGCDTCVSQICADPKNTCCNVTLGTCGHSKCQTGAALPSGCDPCVTTICQQRPQCCDATSVTSCAHSVCASGAALNPTCDTCVQSICNTGTAYAHCCPATFNAACAHSACTVGAALASGCDPCVTDICTNKNKGCCGVSSIPFGTCAQPQNGGHEPCTQGKKLNKACDACVTAICNDPDPALQACCSATGNNGWGAACVAAVATHCQPKSCDTTWTQACSDFVATDAACGGKTCSPSWDQSCINEVQPVCGKFCTATWDQTCVNLVSDTTTGCGQTCSPTWSQGCVDKVNTTCGQTCGTWSQSCVDKVDPVCGALCTQSDPGCAHDKCYTGPPLSASCDPCVSQVCAAHPECCNTYWDFTCRDYISTICGQTCAPNGDCVPWGSKQQDPGCTGVDLTAGVSCTGYVPICNRGQSWAPAGAKVYVYPAGYAKFGTCTPDTSGANVLGVCTVGASLGPGDCLSIQETDCTPVSGTAPILTPGVVLMVNPPIGAANGEQTECHCQDNWTDYHLGGCTVGTNLDYEPTTYTQVYTSNCGPGTHVQWEFFAYESTTPGDSYISFAVHTADAEPVTTPLVQLAIAHSSPSDTQACLMSGPAPCPIDLYATLGLPSATQNVLELQANINPTSNLQTPATLLDWEITYSCPPTE